MRINGVNVNSVATSAIVGAVAVAATYVILRILIRVSPLPNEVERMMK